MNSMMHNVLIRAAVMSERQALEALQRRASLNNPGDGDALLANVPRKSPEMDLDGLFVEPHLWHGIVTPAGRSCEPQWLRRRTPRTP
jgi:hypothetical protein